MRYLTTTELAALHELVIARSGGSPGVRDEGAIESALAQPQAASGGQELYPTLAEKAAALSFSLVKNLAFVDGNKRIGHAALEVFLQFNGFEIEADIDEQERADWTNWVQQHLQSRT